MTDTTICGACARILHLSSSGSAIFAVRPVGTAKTVRVIASPKVMPFTPSAGENIQITGDFIDDIKYGRQLHARTVIRTLPKGKAIVDLLSKHPSFAWLSAISASRLWKRLGEEIGSALAEPNILKLAGGANISIASAIALAKSWRQYALELDAMSFLTMHNLPAVLAGPVIAYWGRSFCEKLTNNPYILVPLSTWLVIDRSCMREGGVPYKTPDRLVAACTSSAAEFVAQRRELGIPIKELTERVRRKVGSMALTKEAIKLAQDTGQLKVISENSSLIFQPKGVTLLQLAVARKISALADAFCRSPDEANENSECFKLAPGLTLWDCSDLSNAYLTLSTLKDALHIFPSVSMGHQAYICRSSFKLLSEVEQLAQAGELPPRQYYIIYCANTLGLSTINRILHCLPPAATTMLVPDCAMQTNVSSFWTWLQSLPSVHRASEARGISRLCDEASKAEMRSELNNAPVTELPEPVSFCFIGVNGGADTINTVLEVYRRAAHKHSALIVAGTKATCELLNQRLHSEVVEMREFEGQPTLSLRLRNGVEATIGDRIVAKHPNFDRNIVVGAFGIVTEINFHSTSGRAGASLSNAIAATVLLDTVGLVQLTFADCELFGLGYAVPLTLDLWSSFDYRIVFLDEPELPRFNPHNALITKTRKSVTFIGSNEHLTTLRECVA